MRRIRTILEIVILTIVPVGILIFLARLFPPWDEHPLYMYGLNGHGYSSFSLVMGAFSVFPLISAAGIAGLMTDFWLVMASLRVTRKDAHRVTWLWSVWTCLIIIGQVYVLFFRSSIGEPPGYSPAPNIYGFSLRMQDKIDVDAIRSWMESDDYRSSAGVDRNYDLPESAWLEKLEATMEQPWAEHTEAGVKLFLGDGNPRVGVFVGIEDDTEPPPASDLTYLDWRKLDNGAWVFSQEYYK